MSEERKEPPQGLECAANNSLSTTRTGSESEDQSEQPESPPAAPFLCARLREHVQSHGNQAASVWINENGQEGESITFQQLWSRAGYIAKQLVSPEVGLGRGDKAVIAFAPSLSFLPALLGCLRAGITAVSITPPNLRLPQSEMARYAFFPTQPNHSQTRLVVCGDHW